ncbi:MAG: hypothetical protein EAY68_10315 [Bacteroidetes bacterium]|nr:MAG: hypothetical protein EAY68_10315 [Bacteroidota bacterium]
MSTTPTMLEKLQLKDEKNLLIQGLPSSIEKQFVKLSYSKNVTPLLKSKKVDFALVFAISQNQLCGILKDVLPALHGESKLWVAYPKKTSKIVTDLNREGCWQFVIDNGYEEVRLIDLDNVWSCVRFKLTESLPNKERAFAEIKMPNFDSADFDKRLVAAPVELEILFKKHKEAKEFFTSLPFNNQKEYISWINTAKRSDTRQRRLEATLEKLLSKKQNPNEK